jgi:hypothetical protein
MKKLLLTMAALALSTSAIAGPSWTYVDLGVVVGDGNQDEDLVGYGLRGSFGFGDLWHIQADVASFEQNGGKGTDNSAIPGTADGTDNTLYTIRGGIHPAVTDNTDFVLDISYTGAEDENSTTKNKPKAYGIRTGVRSNVGKLELRGFVALASTDNDKDAPADSKVWEIIPTIGGQYNFSDAWSVGLDTALEGDNLSNLYVRWSF